MIIAQIRIVDGLDLDDAREATDPILHWLIERFDQPLVMSEEMDFENSEVTVRYSFRDEVDQRDILPAMRAEFGGRFTVILV